MTLPATVKFTTRELASLVAIVSNLNPEGYEPRAKAVIYKAKSAMAEPGTPVGFLLEGNK